MFWHASVLPSICLSTLQHFPEWHGADTGGGYPAGGGRGYPARGVVPCPEGVPCRWGTLVRYPHAPARLGWGGTQVGQQKEYSIHGGRYASCGHAGGLSCLNWSYCEDYIDLEWYSTEIKCYTEFIVQSENVNIHVSVANEMRPRGSPNFSYFSFGKKNMWGIIFHQTFSLSMVAKGNKHLLSGQCHGHFFFAFQKKYSL